MFRATISIVVVAGATLISGGTGQLPVVALDSEAPRHEVTIASPDGGSLVFARLESHNESSPRLAPFQVACKCCKNSTIENEHTFVTGSCTDGEGETEEAGGDFTAFKWQNIPSEWYEPDPSATTAEALLGVSSPRIGLAVCAAGLFCRREASGGGGGGGPGCGDDCTFHMDPTWKQGTCVNHPSCGEPDDLDVLEALAAGNYGRVARHIKEQPAKMWLNAARELLQIEDCRGQVSVQVKVDAARLTALLQ